MYKTGDVIYLDKLYFSSNVKDKKKNRPCLVLFSELDQNKREKIYFCPLTTSQHHFNNGPMFHHMIEHPVFNNRLSFAKINVIRYAYKDNGVHHTGITLKKEAFDAIQKICLLADRIKDVNPDLNHIFNCMNSFVRPLELNETEEKSYQKYIKRV